MSKIKEEVMEKISSGQVKMRSRNFFILMKALLEIFLVALVALVIFIFNLTFYLPRRMIVPGFGSNRFALLLESLPWPHLMLGLLGLGLVIWILYRYTGLYKKHFLLIVSILSFGILLISYIVSVTNFNERLEERRGLRGLYRQQNWDDTEGYQRRGPGFQLK